MSSVAIIGAGPSGLAAAKAIALEPNASTAFSTIDVFERRPKAGGLWYYTGSKTHVTPKVPSPNNAESGEIADPDALTPDQRFVSPMYDNLETNIPKDIMQFKGLPFPDENEIFPTREEVADYVRAYVKTIPDSVKIHLGANIVSLTKKGAFWEIVYEDVANNNKLITVNYDKVVLGQGHFDYPFIPEVDGLDNWYKADPKSITHAKYFNNGEAFKGKNVLVVGNSASGLDIATQSITFAKSVTMSSISESPFKEVIVTYVDLIDKIVKYDFADNRSVTTESGKKISNIDVVVFCTGYLYKIPFLKSYQADSTTPLISDGSQLVNLYKQIFFIPDPSLALMAIPQLVVPFPFSECQAQYVARVLSGRVKLPSKEEQEAEYKKDLEERGTGRAFHVMKGDADAIYCNKLFDLIKGTDNDGFVAEFWTPAKIARRVECPGFKQERLKVLVKWAEQLKAQGKPFKVLRGEFKPS